MAEFHHHDLGLLDPKLSSPIFDVLSDLDFFRRTVPTGTTPQTVFQQLKRVFHLLESLASARIEGNRTTLSDLVEETIADAADPRGEQLREIKNIETAMAFIEETIHPRSEISEAHIRHLHGLTVDSLDPSREGDRSPGSYRAGGVSIGQADHLPPPAAAVPQYMTELAAFINRDDRPKYDLMKVALAHHRFAWIHPFSNGNGRVVRLLTYAMLIKYGFQVLHVDGAGRLLNPAAVFCANRARYYEMLAEADKGTPEGLEAWCTYVLTGIRDEMEKIARLVDYDYLRESILLPAVAYARERQLITPLEGDILVRTIQHQPVKAAHLSGAMPNLNANQRTYQIGKLVDAKMLQPVEPGARYYTLGFLNPLLRGVVRALRQEGFIADALNAPTTQGGPA